MPTIAVDAMGGDHAPDAVVQGVAQISLATDIECLLVGDERRIQSVLEGVSYNPEHIAIPMGRRRSAWAGGRAGAASGAAPRRWLAGGPAAGGRPRALGRRATRGPA